MIDDENPTEVTAGAIVTVTVTLTRHDMSSLFGDDSVQEATAITENGGIIIEPPEVKETNGDVPETEQTVKRPAWLRQKKG